MNKYFFGILKKKDFAISAFFSVQWMAAMAASKRNTTSPRGEADMVKRCLFTPPADADQWRWLKVLFWASCWSPIYTLGLRCGDARGKYPLGC